MSNSVLAGRRAERAFSATVVIDGVRYLGFAGFGYLALTDIPEIRAAARDALDRGVAFSRVAPGIAGALDKEFDDVEQAGARALNAERSIYFATGYLIGMVGLAAVEAPVDLIAIDENAYTNLHHAAKISGLPVVTFDHCEPASLADALRNNLQPNGRPLVVTDGVFGPTGRIPPLSDYAAILSGYDGRMLVDESHAFGTVGENGRGAAELCGVESIATIGATLSKAYCTHGALVGHPARLAERMRTAPVIRASSSGSPLSAAAAAAALHYIEARPQIRSAIQHTASSLRTKLAVAGFDVMPSAAPIVSFTYGKFDDMQNIRLKLLEKGILIAHGVGFPGSPPDGILRCSIFRDHSTSDVDCLMDALLAT
jgi:7-keto-8-aminopelargonate synthetase-like enzyme